MYKASKKWIQPQPQFSPISSSSAASTMKRTHTDSELSIMTNKEIHFWSNRLHLSPSQLLYVSNDELDQRLAAVYQDTIDYYLEREEEIRQHRVRRFKKLVKFKERLVEHQKMIRLTAGAQLSAVKPKRRTAYDILQDAAREIEALLAPKLTVSRNSTYSCRGPENSRYHEKAGGYNLKARKIRQATNNANIALATNGYEEFSII